MTLGEFAPLIFVAGLGLGLVLGGRFERWCLVEEARLRRASRCALRAARRARERHLFLVRGGK